MVLRQQAGSVLVRWVPATGGGPPGKTGEEDADRQEEISEQWWKGGGRPEQVLEDVEHFKLLGDWVSADGSCEEDVKRKLQEGAEIFGSLQHPVWRARGLGLRLKGRIFQTYVLSRALRGLECCSLTAKQERRVQTWYNRCVRSICGINMWHVKEFHISTATVLEKCGLPALREELDRRLLRWLGHVARLGDDRTVKRLVFGHVAAQEGGKASARSAWRKRARQALANFGIPEELWGKLVTDREGWRMLIHGKWRDAHLEAFRKKKGAPKQAGGDEEDEDDDDDEEEQGAAHLWEAVNEEIQRKYEEELKDEPRTVAWTRGAVRESKEVKAAA
eukprot:gene47660-41699_t